MPITNDNTKLVPRTDISGRTLEFDFPALKIGVAEYEEGPTGCTVFFFPRGSFTAVDVRGGSYATMFSDHLRTGDGWTDAICLAGGSIYGLEAATGVAAELFAMSGYSVGWRQLKLVSGAIIYDYGARQNAIYPDKELGRAATRAARTGWFPLGRHGAGCSATVGKAFGFEGRESAGQGGAFRQVGDVKVAVFTVVNAVGAIVDREGRVVRGNFDAETGTRRPVIEKLEQQIAGGRSGEALPGNTTLTVVVANRKAGPWCLRQLAKQVHASMARGIQPFHTVDDGDVLYAVTTSEVEETALGDTALGMIASELAWDAILSCFE